MNYSSIALARSGDPHALETLVAALHPRMVRMAAYYARCCREEADDLLQEAWAGVLEALPNLDLHIGNPEQYLLQYARWRLLDAVRRFRTGQHELIDDEQLDARPCPQQDNAVFEVEMAGFLLQLKHTQRAVLTCLLAGMTWREAGAILGCSSANIAYHVRQIRQHYQCWTMGQPEHSKIPQNSLAEAGSSAI